MRSWSESVGKHCEWFAQDRTVMHLRFGPLLSSSFTVLSWNRWQTSILLQYHGPRQSSLYPSAVPPEALAGFPRFCVALHSKSQRLLPRVIPGAREASVRLTWFASAYVCLSTQSRPLLTVSGARRAPNKGRLGVGGLRTQILVLRARPLEVHSLFKA